MGKPRKLCSNPLHDEWSTVEKRNVETVKVLQYKCLVLIKKLAKEHGFASHRMRSVCLGCQNAIEKHEETQSSEQCMSSAGLFLPFLFVHLWIRAACFWPVFSINSQQRPDSL